MTLFAIMVSSQPSQYYNQANLLMIPLELQNSFTEKELSFIIRYKSNPTYQLQHGSISLYSMLQNIELTDEKISVISKYKKVPINLIYKIINVLQTKKKDIYTI